MNIESTDGPFKIMDALITELDRRLFRDENLKSVK